MTARDQGHICRFPLEGLLQPNMIILVLCGDDDKRVRTNRRFAAIEVLSNDAIGLRE